MSIVAVERALIILQRLSATPDGLSVRETGRELGYSPAVVQKLLAALESQGFAEQASASGRYILGPAALRVGLAGLRRLDIRKIAHPALEALSGETGETALLGVREDDHAIYIDKVVSRHEMRVDAPIGARRPFNCTAAGKILLAFLRQEEFIALAQNGAFASPTPHSRTDPEVLLEECEQIRQQGYAIDLEEYLQGAACVAAPIFNYEGHVFATVAISGPVERIKAQLDTYARTVRRYGQEISAQMGYVA